MILTETEINELSDLIERSDFFDCVVPFARAVEEAILTPSVAGQKRHMKVTRDYSTYQKDSHGRFGTN